MPNASLSDFQLLRPAAPLAEIKQAYRDLARVWHPDRLGPDERLRMKAEAKFKDIDAAYRRLLAAHQPGAESQKTPPPTTTAPRRTPEGEARPGLGVVGVGVAVVIALIVIPLILFALFAG
jgi:DnaJ-like protein